MQRNHEWRYALAVVAAAAGAGFSSGREVVMFFSQMGWASWIGVGFASLMFGTLCAIVCHFARQTGARSFSGVYMRVLDARQGAIVGGLHSLLMAMTAGVMLAATGELAALALPLRNAFWMGVLFSAGVALLLNLNGMRALPTAGILALALCAVMYAGLALDPRPVQLYSAYETVAELSGSVTASILLSTLHAALNASIAGGATACFAGQINRPAVFGAKCGALMLTLLAAANAAVLRGGERLFSQALPTVLLAARWGTFGYYACNLMMWLCSITTLAAALGALIGQMDDGSANRKVLLAALALGLLATLLMGFERFIELGYPMLGWVCVFSLAGLACYYDRTELRIRKPTGS